jgi:hypothetical protein
MIGIAVFGLLFWFAGLCVLSWRYEARARRHLEQASEVQLRYPEVLGTATERERSARWIQYHERLAAKYEQAACYPWRPLEPDPPEPH